MNPQHCATRAPSVDGSAAVIGRFHQDRRIVELQSNVVILPLSRQQRVQKGLQWTWNQSSNHLNKRPDAYQESSSQQDQTHGRWM